MYIHTTWVGKKAGTFPVKLLRTSHWKDGRTFKLTLANLTKLAVEDQNWLEQVLKLRRDPNYRNQAQEIDSRILEFLWSRFPLEQHSRFNILSVFFRKHNERRKAAS
jgi:hypothetical protein